MNTMKRLAGSVAAALLTLAGANPAFGAAATWVGNTDANWATAGNWSGSLPTGNTPNFGAPGTSGLSLTNDLTAGATIAGITFTTGVTGGYTIGGAAISLAGNITGATPSTTVTGTHTINLDMDIGSATRTITTAGSATSYMNITLGGVISGSGSAGLTKVYSSGANNTVVTLTGLNTFPGKVSAAGTPLVINTIADSGVACSLGYNSIFTLGYVTGADGILRYIGGTANSNRQLEIGNTTTSNTRGGRIDNQGSGALTFTAATFNAIPVAGITVARTLTLASTYSGASSEIQGVIQDHNTGGGGLVNVTVGVSGVSGGAWKLSGANTYTGVTTIQQGGILEATTLASGLANSSIGASANAAANLVFGTGGGTLRYVGSANVTIDRGFSTPPTVGGTATIESSGNGTLGFDNAVAIAHPTANQTRTIVLGGSNTGANTFGKNIGDNGTGDVSLNKTGAGRWVLTGANTYSGGTSVSSGTLLVNGTHTGAGNYTVQSGGTLGGTGGITFAAGKDVTVNTGGTIAPGASIGTLSLTNGGLILASQSVSAFEINGLSLGQYDLITSNDQLTYQNGWQLRLQFLNPPTAPLTGSIKIFDFATYSGTANAPQITLYGGSEADSFSFNPTTGILSFSNAFAIPEPATLFLLACGGWALLRAGRRATVGKLS